MEAWDNEGGSGIAGDDAWTSSPLAAEHRLDACWPESRRSESASCVFSQPCWVVSISPSTKDNERLGSLIFSTEMHVDISPADSAFL